MENGYYLIEHEGLLLPARWDGNKWHHEKGEHKPYPDHGNVKGPIALLCPTGCSCTTNPDGSVNVACSGGGPQNP